MPEETSEHEELLRQAARDDSECWDALVGGSRQRLYRMVAYRLDQRLQGRIDPADVVQDAYLAAWQDLPDYIRQPDLTGASEQAVRISDFRMLSGEARAVLTASLPELPRNVVAR
jgi:DNA-directed RNA polymerase specialized sigma24 family protein